MNPGLAATGAVLARGVRAAGEWCLSIALPRICAGCGGLARRDSSLCDACREICLQGSSARPALPEGVARLHRGPELQGAVRRLVHGLKYEAHRCAARDLVDLFLASSSWSAPEGGVLVPVPITHARRRERGYNQAEVLAWELSRRTGIPVQSDFLARTRFRGSQTRRDAVERREALAGMFGPSSGFDARRTPILVDDVLTTGATLSACAAVCLHGGVPEVHGACMVWAGEA